MEVVVVLGYDLAVAHIDVAIGKLSRIRVVSDHQHGLAQLLVGLLQQGEHGFRILGVEIAGGLVRQDDRRLVDQGARQRNPLLLTAGEL